MIPVAYAAASRLGGFRVGCVAAALTATNPLLIWYSQEARAYALFALLGALSVLFFLQAREELGWRPLAAWAVTALLAMATHYFAVFIVAAELVGLIWIAFRRGKTVEAGLAVGLVAVVGLVALLPRALDQSAFRIAGQNWIGGGDVGGLAERIARIPAEFLTGFHPPGQRPLAVVTTILAVAAAAMLLRPGREPERRAAVAPLLLGAFAVLAPIAIVAFGLDYVITRNVIVAWLPLAIVVALGAGAARSGRLGLAIPATICLLGVGMVTAVATDVRHQREDWRSVSEVLASLPSDGRRAILVSPDNALPGLAPYLPEIRELDAFSFVSEVDLVALAKRESLQPLEAPRPPTPPPPAPGLQLHSRIEGPTFTIIRYRAGSRVALSAPGLGDNTLTDEEGIALLAP